MFRRWSNASLDLTIFATTFSVLPISAAPFS
jgi:hypothetical protein